MKGDGPPDPRPMLAIFAARSCSPPRRALSSIPLPGGPRSRGAARAPRSRRRRYRLRAGSTALLRHPPHACDRAAPSRSFRPTSSTRSPRPCSASPPSSAPAERSVAGWVDRRASAVRISCQRRRAPARLPAGGPERARELLRTALRTFEGVELRDPPRRCSAASRGRATGTLRTELVLARPSVEPLARLSTTARSAAAVRRGDGRAASGERRGGSASASTCCRPAGRRRTRLRRRLQREARRLHGERRGLGELLDGEARAAAPARPRRAGRAPPGRRRRSTRSCAIPARCSRRRSSSAAEAPTPAGARRRCGLLAAFEPLAALTGCGPPGLPIPGARLPRLRHSAAARQLRPPPRHAASSGRRGR